jgi:hypothetical protein
LHGATIEKFNPPELQERNDCTLESMFLESLETSPVMFPTKKKSAMPDCPQITNEKRVKLESSIDFTQEQKSSKISEVNLISEKKGLYPFWTESILEKSKKLLFCTMTECEDLVSDLSNLGLDSLKCVKTLHEGTWFTIKLTEVNKQSPVNSLKSCLSSFFLLSKTIDSAVGTEKEYKKRTNRENQRTGREKHHHQVVLQ